MLREFGDFSVSDEISSSMENHRYQRCLAQKLPGRTVDRCNDACCAMGRLDHYLVMPHFNRGLTRDGMAQISAPKKSLHLTSGSVNELCCWQWRRRRHATRSPRQFVERYRPAQRRCRNRPTSVSAPPTNTAISKWDQQRILTVQGTLSRLNRPEGHPLATPTLKRALATVRRAEAT